MHALAAQTFAALSWDPAIRGILAVAVAVLILVGSIYLLLATNTGVRTGMLIALTALLGWMMILGIIWTTYGKGVADQGRLPTWKVIEVNTGDLENAATPQARDLSKWTELPPADRGEAQASAEAQIVGDEPEKPFKESTDLVVVDAFDFGGEDYGPLGLDFTPFNFLHKPHYAILQAQAAEKVEVAPGETPPKPTPDESAPVISVIMERDLGNVRQRPLFMTIGVAILFALSASALHRRDKLATRNRAEADVDV